MSCTFTRSALVTPSVVIIIREGRTFQISPIMQTGRSPGMTTMNTALLELVCAGRRAALTSRL